MKFVVEVEGGGIVEVESRSRRGEVEEVTMGEAHSSVLLGLQTSTKPSEAHSSVRLRLPTSTKPGFAHSSVRLRLLPTSTTL